MLLAGRKVAKIRLQQPDWKCTLRYYNVTLCNR